MRLHARARTKYLRRKANGKQKEYEERTKAKKKAEIDAMQNSICAEDMAKGMFVPIGRQEPKRAEKAV